MTERVPFIAFTMGRRHRDSYDIAKAYVITYIIGMRTTSYTDFRRNLAATIDSVNADHEPVIITRDGGKPAAVLMSLEDYASFEETRYLLQNPRNAKRLLDSVRSLDAGEGKRARAARLKLVFSERAWDDYLYWQANDAKILARLNGLIRESTADAICRHREA